MTPATAPRPEDVGRRADGTVHCALTSVTKSFGGVTAVQDVDFDVRAGEVHALVGENGAGKSTLMKILAGVHRPDSGEMRAGGEAVAFDSAHDAEMAGIVMIPQELELFPEMTIAENLVMGLPRTRNRWGTFDGRAMRRQAIELLDRLGFSMDVTLPVKRLSAGNRQIVAIARALARDARVLIMDEPTAALPDRDAKHLFGIIDDLRGRGVGIVYISHRLDEIFELADRITVMRDGERVASELPSAVTENDLVRLMVGRPLSQFYARRRRDPGELLLETRDLGRPGGFDGIDLRLHAGEVVGVWGLIGAGRTELAQAIAGVDPARSGELVIEGEPVRVRSIADGLRHGVVYVPEERRSQGLVLEHSIEQNITLSRLRALSHHGYLRPSSERALADRFAGELTIRGAGLDAPVNVLSGGNQQKVVVAKSLATEPRVLLLDEPTRGIDVGAKAEIYRLMDDLVDEGKAILFISSDLQEVLAIADRVIVMAGGEQAAELPVEEATAEGCLAAAMGVTPSVGTPAEDTDLARPAVAPPAPVEAAAGAGSRLARFMLRPEAPSLIFLVLLAVVLSIVADGFFSADNVKSLLSQVAVVGIVAFALNQVLLCGDIDISMGSVLAACIYVTGWVAHAVGGLWLPLLAGVAAGLVFGAINGTLVVRAAMPSIVATLGTMSILRGLVLSRNETINSIPDATRALGQGLGYFAPGLIFLVFLLVYAFIANGTRWGREVVALGDNAAAARLAGIRTGRTRFLAFLGVGAATGLAAVIYLGQAGAAQPSVATGLELQIIAAAVVGGTSPMGGRGSNVSPFVGALLIGLIYSGLALLAVPGTLQDLVFGAVILIAISVDVVRRHIVERIP
ncbi:MAG TPA: ATP-binding cassette domain-containing protein [Baekduia sp.]|uniref:ATP-binding cassette domain-containing protein n=1 Tax=Baekduia sp. TaxID=2600305 RepID=UPI002D77355C|nr:ATP-binding cassette domain-containing protein [Baekduia sp.]HET6507967.1 ATP-binding cassette domain-containing protein [Baekduia sp.]